MQVYNSSNNALKPQYNNYRYKSIKQHYLIKYFNSNNIISTKSININSKENINSNININNNII